MTTINEQQKAGLKGHVWKMTLHMAMEKKHVLQYHCETLGLHKIIVTPKKKNGDFGNAKVEYAIDGEKKTFDDLASAVARLDELGKLYPVQADQPKPPMTIVQPPINEVR